MLVRGAGQGPATWALGSVFERLASHEETAGSFGLSLVTQPAGTATPVHIHTEEDEAFYLLGGTTTYSADGQIHRLSRGSFIFLPRGLPHAFRVTSSDPVRFLALADVGRWLEAAPRYGLRIVGPPLPEDA